MKLKSLIPFLLGASLVAGASAAITVSNTASGIFDPGPAGEFAIFYQPTATNSMLVVAFYMDGGGGRVNAAGFGFGTGIGDQTAGGFVSDARSTMAYFSNPSISSGLSIHGVSGNTGITNAGYYIWELAGVDLAAPVASTIGSNDATQITTTAPNSLILSSVGFNPFGTITSVIPDATNSILAKTFDLDVNAGIGGGWLSVGQATASSAGTNELGWTVTVPAGFGDQREAAFAFAPIPELSGSALFLGSLGMLALRRRRSA